MDFCRKKNYRDSKKDKQNGSFVDPEKQIIDNLKSLSEYHI